MKSTLSATGETPLILTVPGLDGSGPAHWQSIWERERDDCARADLGDWSRPTRNGWVNRLGIAIRACGRPVILAAHSLGCHAVAWWAALERPAYGDPVVGALLVAPPDLDAAPVDARLAAFGRATLAPLPFPSIVVASQDDPFVQRHRARRLSEFWGGRFVDAGAVGHVNADSGLGNWAQGVALLEGLRGAGAPVPRHAVSGRLSPTPGHPAATRTGRIDFSA